MPDEPGILVSVATGRRPVTAELSFRANLIQAPHIKPWLTIVRWDQGLDLSYLGDEVRILEVPGGYKGKCHVTALLDWTKRVGEPWPDYWFLMDDDMVVCQGMFERMMRVLDADEELGMLGAWNEGSERQPDGDYRGKEKLVAGETVQYGGDFCIGGAAVCVPKRALQKVGPINTSLEGVEDAEYTCRTREHGYQAALCRTVFAVCLRDDLVDSGYRDLKDDQFRAGLRHLGWPPDSTKIRTA